MEIKSTLLNDPDFIHVKNSLIKISEKDHKENFRVKMIEYINDSSDSEDDQFFYDMLEFIRFLDPSSEAVAYTTPNKLISLNAPGIIGENLRHWDFIYDHECLHQLWDTFAVGDKIKKEGKEYNHQILNIASDCVINDYLSYNRKKLPPDNLVSPAFIKNNFGVEFDRKADTQYSLYLKLINSPKKKEIEEYAKQQEKIHDGKITPKQVKDAEDGGGGGPSVKHSDDYKKGWVDGINDVLDGKVDPKNYTHKPDDNDYNRGYNDVLDKIKKGIEEGIQRSKGGTDGGGGSSDLPQIPWDAPNMQDDNGDGGDSGDNSKDNQLPSNDQVEDMNEKDAAESAQKSADKAKEAAAKAKKAADDADANNEKDAASKQRAANKAKAAADKAQEAADKAQEAAENGDKKEAQKQAKKAADKAKEAIDEANKAIGSSNSTDSDINNMDGDEAAEEAQDAADAAQKAADDAKKKAEQAENDGCENADDLKDAADKAQEAADKAQDAADKAKEAAENGDTEDARDAAKEARKQMKKAQNQANKQQGKPMKGWSHAGNVQEIDGIDDSGEEVDIEEISKKAKETIKKWQQKISGDIGDFIQKCRKSVELNPTGLTVKIDKGASLWAAKMSSYMTAFVKNKLAKKHREFKRTYKRIKRGTGIIKFGEPLQKGKQLKDDKLTINVAFYIDTSGSMTSMISQVFDAAYQISESIKKQFGNDKVVDGVEFKMFEFNDYIKELKWGTKTHAKGGNVEFSEIVKYMSTHTKTFMINVVITDARFDIGKNQIKTFIKDIDGMLLFITNQGSKDMEELSKEFKTQIFYILADANFTVK